MDNKKVLEQIKHSGNRDWRLAIEDTEKDLERLEKQDKILGILKEYLTPHILEELCIEEKEVWEWLEK